MARTYGYWQDSHFFIEQNNADGLPEPLTWLAWHMTHFDNVASILESGHLLAESTAPTTTNIGLSHIKDRRASTIVTPDPQYPSSMVADHVPFYFAALSPMRFIVSKGHEDWDGGIDDAIFLAVHVGDVVAAQETWCVSNMNASTSGVEFSRDLTEIPNFVDLQLLRSRSWGKTTDDPTRPSRRAAELLIHERVPLDLVKLVGVKNDSQKKSLLQAIASAGANWSPDITIIPDLYN